MTRRMTRLSIAAPSIAAFWLLCLPASYADTDNVREGHAQLEFLTASASGGSTAARPPAALPADKGEMFRHLDIDADGRVSKAEAAGHAAVTLGFDRADRNHDGKLSFAEFDSIGKPPRARKKARAAKAN